MKTASGNELNMMERVYDFAFSRKSETASLPGYNNQITNLGITVRNVKDLDAKLVEKRSGRKDVARNTLILEAAETSSKAVSYASNTDNADLLATVKFSIGSLRKMTDSLLEANTKLLYDHVNEELEEMKQYGLDSKSQERLLAARSGFESAKPTVKEGISSVKELNKDIRKGLAGGLDILQKMDKAVGPLEFSNLNYFDNYHTLRKVVDSGKRSMALKIQVNDKDTGEGIEGAKVVIVPTDGSGALLKSGAEGIKKKTAKKGGIHISNLAEGTYQLTVTKVGRKDVVVSIVIVNEKMTMVEVGI
jgi:hypothetical protein